MKPNNLIGQRFGRLVVTHDGGRCKRKNILWACACDCGGTTRAPAYDLRAGKVTSCGCRNREGKTPTHGMTHTPIYNVWATMVQRCTNPNDRNWGKYGGRGIDLDPRWLYFAEFYSDMGSTYAPRLTLERRDNDKGYNPSNCHWVTHAEQNRNKRSNVYVVVAGEKMIQMDAAKTLGITYATLWNWRKTGMTDEQIEERAKWLAQKRGSSRTRSSACSNSTAPTTRCP